RMREVPDRLVEVVHPERHAAAWEVEDVTLDRLAAVGGGERQPQLAGARHHEVLRAVLVAERVAADDDRLRPTWDEPGDVADDDRLAEDHPAEDVADGAVRGAVHPLEPELLHARLVGGDRRALHPDAALLDRV